MNTAAIDQLGIQAAGIAGKAAVEKLGRDRPDLLRRVRDEGSFQTAFMRVINHCSGSAVLAAFDDAKEAADVGMFAVAEQTFAASMVLAGVRAAQEFILIAEQESAS